MSLSPFDAIMPLKSSRSTEPGRRGGERSSPFAPAMAQAYQAERPRLPAESSKPAPPAEQQPTDAPAGRAAHDEDREETSTPSIEEKQPAATKEAAEPAEPPEDEQDAVEISAAGAVAVTVREEAAKVDADAERVVAAAAVEAGGEATESAEEGNAANGRAADGVNPLDVAAGMDVPEDGSSAEQPANGEDRADGGNPHGAPKPKRVKGDAAAADAPTAHDPEHAPRPPDIHESSMADDAEGAVGGPLGDHRTTEGVQKRAVHIPQNDGAPPTDQAAPRAAAPAAPETFAQPGADASSATSPVADVKPAAAPANAATPPAATDRAASALERLSARAMRQAEKPQEPDASAHVDRTRFVQRVEGAIRAAQQRDGTIQVRLSPPELGNLRIELAIQNGVMTAKLEAETPAARNVLLDSLPQLRERLAQQDIRVEKFDVDVRRDGGNANSGPFDQQDRQSRDERAGHRTRPLVAPIMRNAAARPPAATAITDAALDVRI